MHLVISDYKFLVENQLLLHWCNRFASSNLVNSEVIFLNKRSGRSQVKVLCLLTKCNCPKIDGTLFGYSTVVSTILFWLCPGQERQRDYKLIFSAPSSGNSTAARNMRQKQKHDGSFV